MYNRIMLKELHLLANSFRVLTVLGPRQAGKSTLCRTAFPEYRYVSLEDPDQRAFAEEDAKAFLAQYNKRVILDEIQRVPKLLSYIQGIVDSDQSKGQFILSGSHQLELSQAITQSLAGRTALLTLLPLSFEELPAAKRSAAECAIQGFMPGLHIDAIDPSRFYRSYFQTYIERDVRLLVNLRDFSHFEKFVRLSAGRVGQVLNLASLANDVGVSPNTIQHWVSILEASFIAFRLQPYFENFGKRLIKAPKLYFNDTGLLCWLLGIETEQQLIRDPLFGSVIENMVILEALKFRLNRGKEPGLYYFRDNLGNEIDLVLSFGRQLKAIEIKSAQTFSNHFCDGLNYFKKLVGDRSLKGGIIYSGKEERSTDNYDLINFANSIRALENPNDLTKP